MIGAAGGLLSGSAGLRVRGDADEVQNARTLCRTDRAGADVLAFEAHLAGAQSSHDVVRDVVATIPAAVIAAWKDEEGRRMRDDHPSDVRRFRNAASLAPLVDLEGQAPKGWHLGGKSRCLVLAPAALGEPLCGLAESSVVMQLDSSPFRCRVVASVLKGD